MLPLVKACERKPMLFFVRDAASLKADAKRCIEQ